MKVQPVAMPVCELCDRYTIAQLKLERLPDSEIDKEGLRRQIRYYDNGIDRSLPGMADLLCNLLEINASIWDAEAAIRQGLDADLGLSEIGSRAIRIRDLNRIRVRIKNQIAQLTEQSDFVDCKMNHASS
jgi:hypothetical protein